MELTKTERHVLKRLALACGKPVDERDVFRDVFPDDVTQGRPILEDLKNAGLIDYVGSSSESDGMMYERYRITPEGKQDLERKPAK